MIDDLRQLILTDFEKKDDPDSFYNFEISHKEYSYEDIRAANIELNHDQSFQFVIKLEKAADHTMINYHFYESKQNELSDLKHVISYLDDLKQTILKHDNDDKVGYVTMVDINDETEIYVEGIGISESIDIRVTKSSEL